MADIKYLINGIDYGPPRDWQDLTITADWLNEKQDLNINVNNVTFVKKAKRALEERLAAALSGGKSIFEGEPLDIIVGPIDDPHFTFNGYIDFADETNLLSHSELEEITVPIKKKQGNDWLNDVADGFSFAYLEDQGIINNSHYTPVPYIINYVPDGLALITLSISVYMMTKELIENIEKLGETIADVTDAATPIFGVSAAGPVTGYDIGNFILVTLKAIARIAYIIGITIAIINLINEIFEQLFPKKRFHVGMKVPVLFERACSYLGLEFQSDLLNSPGIRDRVIIPSKDRRGASSGIGGQKGFPLTRGPISTFGDLIRVYQEKHNGDFRIVDGVFRFERWDYWQQQSTFVMPKYFSIQDRLLTGAKLNTSEMISNYNINYDFDRQDQNTLDDVTGQVFQAIQAPSSVTNPELVNTKGLGQINIPFSIGKRKDGLTALEKAGRALGRVVDQLTGVFGGGTNFENQIEARVGAMLLSSHFLTVPRIVQMRGNKLEFNQRDILSAEKLWFNYHFINTFVPIDGQHNQWLIIEGVEIPLSGQQFESILNNNFVTDQDGNIIRIDRLEWEPERGAAKIDFRVKRIYDNNLQIRYV